MAESVDDKIIVPPTVDNGEKKRLFIKIIFFVIIVLALVNAGWFVFGAMKKNNEMSKQVEDKSSVATSTMATEQATTTEITFEEEYKKAIEEAAKTDQDLDGLLDVEEQKYGTSATSSDTDSDGLLDKDEINIYKTDPLKFDSDDDGYGDGAEVRKGFNPMGKGKL